MKTTILTFFALFAGIGQVHADQMSATLEQPLHETSHFVRLYVDGGVATYTVQRTFANSGEIPEEAVLILELPTHAVATGLRIRSGQKWYDGELLEAEEAAAKYEELTGIGVSRSKDPALLSWINANNLELRVFPVPVGGTATLEYTLTVPVQWKDGRWTVDYPRQSQEEGSHFAPIILTLAPGQEFQGIRVDGRPVSFNSPLVLSPVMETDDGDDSQLAAQIQLQPTHDVIRARLGSTHAAYAHEVFSFYQVEVPEKLSQTPETAHVVFVVDRSRSIPVEQLDAQFRIMSAFADHLRGGQFQVILVDRFAKPLLRDFTSAQEFAEVIEMTRAGRLEFKNGSNLDAGLRLARQLLGDKEGPRYIIGFTDDHLRSSLDVPSLAESSKITTHMVVLGQPWSRDDAHRLAKIAKTGKGILVHASDSDELQRHAEHLVRPTRLESVAITGMEEEIHELGEGESFEFTHFSEKRPSRDYGVIRAKLWQDDVSISPERNRRFDRATAGWLFSREAYWNLDPDTQMKLARYANAVTPLTSFLAIEPGVRPSPPPSAVGGFWVDGMQTGAVGGDGSGVGKKAVVVGSIFDEVEALCRSQYPGMKAQITVHTTLDEIVDVLVRSTPNTFSDCMVEGIWEVELPTARFRPIVYSTQSLSF